MKCRFRTLALAVILSVLLLIMLATPVLAAPAITLSPASGSVGVEVTVTGTNFTSYIGDSISILFNNVEIKDSPLTVPSNGSFSIDFNIPGDAKPGTVYVTVRDKDGNKLGTSASFTIWEPEIQLDTDEGAVGTTVVVEGRGFYAGKRVNFYFNGTEIKLGSQVATDRGEYSHSFTIPEGIVGKHEIVAQNAQGHSAKVYFEVIPSITVTPSSGAMGDRVAVSGTGFGYRKDITITLNDDEVDTDKTDKKGNFEASFNVPVTKPGIYEVMAEDEDGNKANEVRFKVVPFITLGPTSGAIGAKVTVSGTGFGYRKDITITFDGNEVATDGTGKKGSFEAGFNVPVTKPGIYEVMAKDEDGNIAKIDFTLAAVAASLNLTTGNIGTELTINGTGFIVGGIVTIKYDGNEVATATADSRGAFSAIFKAPASKYGPHTVTVSDGANTEQFTFTMELTPPPIPELLVPEDADKAKAEVYFDWGDVKDPSGVTYTLQVAEDKRFTAIVLEEKGLIYSDYIVTKEEKLQSTKKEAPYYWRVKAIDGAGNESEWSTPMSFYVGFSWALPTGVVIFLIVLGVLLIGFLAFWGGRRTAYY